MTDAQLQSFCERCGTRYTSDVPIQAPPPESGKSRLSRFAKRGSDDSAEVQPPTPATASPAADAFAATFHFCMDCRQYVCTKCWNSEAGGCLSDHPPGRSVQSGSSPATARSPFAATDGRTA